MICYRDIIHRDMNIELFIKEIELFLPNNKAELMAEILDQRT